MNSENALRDFWWENVDATQLYMVPENGAKVVNLGTSITYEEIDIDDFKNQDFSSNQIDANANANEIPDGTILLWITAEGNYVKMIVDLYSTNLEFSFFLFPNEGEIGLVWSSYHFDFESNSMTSETLLRDFWWENVDGQQLYIVPENGAKVAHLGTSTPYVSLGIQEMRDASYSTTSIDANLNGNGLQNYSVLLWITAEGNYAKMKIDNHAINLEFTSYVFPNEGESGLVWSSYHFDFESNSMTSETLLRDFWWENVDGTERYMVLENGAKVSNLGKTTPYNSIDLQYVQNAEYTSDDIDASFGSGDLQNYSILLWITGEGNYVKMKIDLFAPTLQFTFKILGEFVEPVQSSSSGQSSEDKNTDTGNNPIPGYTFHSSLVGFIIILSGFRFLRRSKRHLI